ncbi:MAG: O-acetyl-ADP-ribose deacetylase [Arenicellales bacterium]|nr:O-acetyl-ADP-ribose deacetylase [Arenicellales bacterium]
MLRVIEADITTLALDAIVNAANETLLGGGGVDGAVHRAAGPKLLEACKAIGGCPTGQARITNGFDLPSKWVIHTVGPRWHGGDSGEPELLESCYDSALELAIDNRVRTVAFPGISTGIYGYPKQAAAKIAVSVMRRYENKFEEIVICCFGTEDKVIYEKTLETD